MPGVAVAAILGLAIHHSASISRLRHTSLPTSRPLAPALAALSDAYNLYSDEPVIRGPAATVTTATNGPGRASELRLVRRIEVEVCGHQGPLNRVDRDLGMGVRVA